MIDEERELAELKAFNDGYRAAMLEVMRQRKIKTARRKALAIQKLIGLVLAMVGVLSAWLMDGDITVAIVLMILAVYLIFARKVIKENGN